MFKIRRLTHRPWPVSITMHECDPETGEVKKIEGGFIVHFTVFNEAGLAAIRKEIYGDESDAEIRKKIAETPNAVMAEMEATYFSRIITGWSKLGDDQGVPVPYSEQMLRDLCCGPDGAEYRAGLNGALLQIRLGMAPQKNFATSPSPGQKNGEASAETSSSET